MNRWFSLPEGFTIVTGSIAKPEDTRKIAMYKCNHLTGRLISYNPD
jgi:hypothetical protein